MQLFILVGDADGDPAAASDDDIVDIFHININSSVSSATKHQHYNGIYKVAQFEISYEVSCADNFSGEFCENLDQCLLNNVSCSENGKCLNEPDTFSCMCEPGFTGELCQESIDTCVGVDCSGKGQCVDSADTFICVCDSGYNGSFCENSIEFDININSQQSGSMVGAIIGGVVGAIVTVVFLVLLVIVGLIVLIKKLKWSTTYSKSLYR